MARSAGDRRRLEPRDDRARPGRAGHLLAARRPARLAGELAALPAYAEHLRGVPVPDAHDAATYLAALRRLGCTVDAWETTYLHVLTGDDAVFEWVSATGARPTLNALPAGLRARFEADYRARLREAYPADDGQVVLPFRRVFVVARVPRNRREAVTP